MNDISCNVIQEDDNPNRPPGEGHMPLTAVRPSTRPSRRASREGAMEIIATLPTEERAAYTARRFVDAIEPFVGEEEVEEVRVLINELVTNSIVHAAGATSIVVEIKVQPMERVR